MLAWLPMHSGFAATNSLACACAMVDMLNEMITLDAGTTKNDECRTVKMTREVFELLVGCLRGKGPEDFVFTHEDGSRIKDFRGVWHATCVKAGVYRAANMPQVL